MSGKCCQELQNVIKVMRALFAAHGLPEQVVSDNGPQFTSEEFKDFMKGNHIKHILSTPYHPSTNRLAVRFVQTFKKAMWASENSGKPLSYRLVNFLLSYRSTPHATTNRTKQFVLEETGQYCQSGRKTVITEM